MKEPGKIIKGISEFLGIDPHENMLKPYAEKEQRMTNGIHPLSKMLGDIKFHEHKEIDANAAERWKESYSAEELGDLTWELAERLGYESQKKKRSRVRAWRHTLNRKRADSNQASASRQKTRSSRFHSRSSGCGFLIS